MSKTIKKLICLMAIGGFTFSMVSSVDALEISKNSLDDAGQVEDCIAPPGLSLKIDDKIFYENDGVQLDKCVGEDIKIHATGLGFSNYKFLVNGQVEQERSENGDFVFKPEKEGQYKIQIQGSLDDGSVIYTTGITINAANLVEDKLKLPSIYGIKENEITSEDGKKQIEFTTETSGGQDLIYQYYITPCYDDVIGERLETYLIEKEYSEDNKFVWEPKDEQRDYGKYEVCVRVTTKNNNGFVEYNTVKFFNEKYNKIDEVAVDGVLLDDSETEITKYLGDNISFTAYNGPANYGFYVDGKQEDRTMYYNSFDLKPEKVGVYNVQLETIGENKEKALKNIKVNVVEKDKRAPEISTVDIIGAVKNQNSNVRCHVNCTGEGTVQYKYEIIRKVINNLPTGYFVYPVEKYTLVKDFSEYIDAEWYQDPTIKQGEEEKYQESGTALIKVTEVVYGLRVTAKNDFGYDIEYINYKIPDKEDIGTDTPKDYEEDEDISTNTPKDDKDISTNTPKDDKEDKDINTNTPKDKDSEQIPEGKPDSKDDNVNKDGTGTVNSGDANSVNKLAIISLMSLGTLLLKKTKKSSKKQ